MITRRRLIQAGGAIGGFIVGQRLGGLPTAWLRAAEGVEHNPDSN